MMPLLCPYANGRGIPHIRMRIECCLNAKGGLTFKHEGGALTTETNKAIVQDLSLGQPMQLGATIK